MDAQAHQRNLLADAAEKRLLENQCGDNENLADGTQVISTSSSILSTSMERLSLTNVPNANIRRSPGSSPSMSKLRAGPDHAVLVWHHVIPGTIPRPYPERYVEKWDSEHVRLPCSPSHVVDGEKVWERMERTFLRPITDAMSFERTVLAANPELYSNWTFDSLTTLLNDILPPTERDGFFSDVLPALIGLAFRLPDICTQPIPMLSKHRDFSITLSQHQIGCLLANAFLCTFPRRGDPEYRIYPTINFGKLFAPTRGPRRAVKSQKIRCLLNYFRRVTSVVPSGLITFHRKFLSIFPDWSESRRPIGRLHAQSEGSIEIDGTGLLQVDFANRKVGGGVLNTGCVQEEIRFVLCPELIAARLFTECLDDGEVLVVTGCERFNSHSGYGDDFKWVGDHVDDTPTDAWGRRNTQIVAMDATRFGRREEQYKPERLLREVNKVFCAFHESKVAEEDPSAVATGNWGCGAYRGDARLKALLQLIAASEARRDVEYFTFGDGTLMSELNEMCLFLLEKNVTVGSLWTLLLAYYNDSIAKNQAIPLYQYIYKSFNTA